MLDNINPALLLDHIGDAQATPLAIKDLDHRFVYVNSSFCDAIGLSSDALIGKNDLELGRSEKVVMGDPDTGWVGLWALDNQAIQGKCPTRNIDGGAGRSWTETVRIPLLNENGTVVALLVQLSDVSEVRELQKRVATNINALSLREGEISTMDSVLASLMACQDTDTLLSQLAKILVERTRADCAYAAILHESGEFMEIVGANESHSSELIGGQFRRNEGTIGRAWHRGEAIFLDDVSAIQTIHQWPQGTQAFSLPLFVDDEAVAALTVISEPDSDDLSHDVPLLQRICGMASMAIANTRMMDVTRQQLKGTRALAEVSQILLTLDHLDEACDEVCRVLLPAMDATRASIFLLNDDGDLEPLVSWGLVHGSLNRATVVSPMQFRNSIAQWCVENDQIVTIGRLEEDPRESAEVHAMRGERNLGSTCCIPLKRQGGVFGAAVLCRTRDMREFSEAHIDMFQSIVNQLSTAFDRIELAKELQHQAFHDQLTGLPNRRQFERLLEGAVKPNDDTPEKFSILFIDLDGFKDVNDSRGHAAGDRLLRMVASRLSSRLSNHSVLARMGGDEFAVILRNADGTSFSHTLLDCLRENFCLDGEQIRIGASIGVSTYPENGTTVGALLQSADEAMYQAKHVGKNCVYLFNESLAATSRQRILLETQLRGAIEKREFHLLYQPQVRCRDNQVVGVEALIRWVHPERGLVPPKEFIPLAENLGLINQIGNWVIEESVRQLAQWQDTAARDVRVSINIAAPQFQMADFCDRVINVLTRHCIAAHQLELEVTESVLMDDVELVVARLQKLREHGLRIAIDDFGTGYSSLGYLQDLPLDVLKIDRIFVDRLNHKRNNTWLIDTIQTLATGLGLETVAEGVELPEQLDQLSRLGCDHVQGYLYSRPVPAADIPATIQSINSQFTHQRLATARPSG